MGATIPYDIPGVYSAQRSDVEVNVGHEKRVQRRCFPFPLSATLRPFSPDQSFPPERAELRRALAEEAQPLLRLIRACAAVKSVMPAAVTTNGDDATRTGAATNEDEATKAVLESLGDLPPTSFLAPSSDLSQQLRTAVKALFDSGMSNLDAAKGAASDAASGGGKKGASGFTKSQSLVPERKLPGLFVDGFDSEQIWCQLDLALAPTLPRIRRRLKRAEELTEGKAVVRGEEFFRVPKLVRGKGGKGKGGQVGREGKGKEMEEKGGKWGEGGKEWEGEEGGGDEEGSDEDERVQGLGLGGLEGESGEEGDEGGLMGSEEGGEDGEEDEDELALMEEIKKVRREEEEEEGEGEEEDGEEEDEEGAFDALYRSGSPGGGEEEESEEGDDGDEVRCNGMGWMEGWVDGKGWGGG
ncbi:unnamed protein product [Closterium sp. Yama58-4]|nr:unnamed protein product [Closterium sp. Yama58-4]